MIAAPSSRAVRGCGGRLRDDNRWLDFVLELEGQMFDILDGDLEE